MLGLKSFRTAAIVIGGIELAEKIKKDQFKIGSSADGPQGCQRSGKPHLLHNSIAFNRTTKTTQSHRASNLHQNLYRAQD